MSTRINIDRQVLNALLQGKIVCVGNVELHPKDLGEKLELWARNPLDALYKVSLDNS